MGFALRTLDKQVRLQSFGEVEEAISLKIRWVIGARMRSLTH